MIDFIFERIKGLKLTKTEKKIAEYFCEKNTQLIFLTSEEIAEELEISDTSVIRFVKKLDFDGFGHFKNFIQKELSTKMLTPTQKLNKNKTILESEDILNSFLNHMNISLKETFSKNSLEQFEQVCRILKDSGQKFIIGFKSASNAASYFGLRLGLILPQVRIYTQEKTEVIESLIDISENDCLLLIAFPRYSKMNSIIKEIAKKKGAKIIAVTDKITSPIIEDADITLIIDIEGISYFNSSIPTQAVFEFILTNLSRKLNKANEDRLNLINSYLSKIN